MNNVIPAVKKVLLLNYLSIFLLKYITPLIFVICEIIRKTERV